MGVLGHSICHARKSQLAVLGAGSEEFLKGNIRVAKELDGLGCLGDMGWYCIRAILWAFSWDLPHSVQATPGGRPAPHDDSSKSKVNSTDCSWCSRVVH